MYWIFILPSFNTFSLQVHIMQLVILVKCIKQCKHCLQSTLSKSLSPKEAVQKRHHYRHLSEQIETACFYSLLRSVSK